MKKFPFKLLSAGLAAAMLSSLMAFQAAAEPVFLNNCDNLKDWLNPSEGYYKSLTIDTKEKTQGTGSVRAQVDMNKETGFMMIYSTKPTVDIGDNTHLEFDLYLPTPNLFKDAQDCAIEISSANTWDKQEAEWGAKYIKEKMTFKQGWNHVRLALDEANYSKRLGKVDFKKDAVNFFRVYAIGLSKGYNGGELVAYLDNVRFTKGNGEVPDDGSTPTVKPTDKPTQKPTDKPTQKPTDKPTQNQPGGTTKPGGPTADKATTTTKGGTTVKPDGSTPVTEPDTSASGDVSGEVSSDVSGDVLESSPDVATDETQPSEGQPESSAQETIGEDSGVSPLPFIIIGIVVVLAGGGAAAWYFLIYKKKHTAE